MGKILIVFSNSDMGVRMVRINSAVRIQDLCYKEAKIRTIFILLTTKITVFLLTNTCMSSALLLNCGGLADFLICHHQMSIRNTHFPVNVNG